MVGCGLCAVIVGGCAEQPDVMPNSNSLPPPPKAETRPHAYTHHGITVEDPFQWLKDASYPTVDDADVLAYLEAENRYFEAAMAPHAALVDSLFEEIKARQQPDEASVPVREGAWFYQWRYEQDGQYRIWSRWPADAQNARFGPAASGATAPADVATTAGAAAAVEAATDGGAAVAAANVQTILDEPALAEGLAYFRLGALAVSNGGQLMAYSTDTSGAERFRLVVKDLRSGELLEDAIEETIGSPVWAADDSAFLYTVVDENWRPYQVRRHRLGEPAAKDAIVYEEPDPGFFVGISASASKQHVIIHTADHVTSEVYLVPAQDLDAKPRLVAPRRPGHEYAVDHQGDRFIIRTNDRHRNTRLATAAGDDLSEDAWTSLLEGTDALYIRGFEPFADFIAVQERVGGLDQIRLIDRAGQSTHIDFPEAAYAVSLGSNPEYQTRTLRLNYTSMVSPDTVYDYHLDSGELETRKVREIPSGYDAGLYVTERLNAPARDGAQVPVSIVRRKNTPTDGSAPLYLYAYGAYGYAIPPSFSASRLSLLDRGFIAAIAHIRGGDDLGYHWYEAGKLKHRTNTFNDFVDVAQHLIDTGHAKAGHIAIAGGSAGGTLMGAVVNQAPHLWGAVAAHVPFVDVLNTMLDDSLPLTPIEWPEWGNPIEDAEAFRLIRSYSPYDQLKPGAYPPMLVTAGLNDPRVTYWEPAKYVAKLRTLKADDNLLLLKTNMGAGHGGKSGRFDSLREVAEEYAFILAAMELVE